MKKCIQLFLFLIILSTSLFALNKQKILILHSYNQSYAWTNNINEGIFSVLKKYASKSEIFVEYMDTKRFVDENHYSNLVELYKQKFKNIKFDVIISSDNNALNFIKKHNKTLFKSSPVVFCGINFLKEKDTKGYDNITGVGEDIDINKSYSLLKQLHPNLKNVYSITDTSTTGQRIKKEIDVYVSKLPNDGISYITIDDVTFDELKGKVKKLPENSVILHHMFFRSNDNKFYDYNESTKMISTHSNTPLYTTADMYLNQGSVGGFLNSGFFQGETAALMAVDVLNGKSIKDLPVVYESPNKYMFDYNKLKKFKINNNLLPADSIIINKPDNLYEMYKNEIIIISILFLLMFIQIILLLNNINKRKSAEKQIVELNISLEEKVKKRTSQLEESNKSLERTISNLKITQAKLVESEKMASLGGLVAGVAHEINTPVGIGITGMSHLIDITKNIKNKYYTDEMSQDDFEEYLNTSNELASLVNTNLERTALLVKSFKQIAVDQTHEEKRDFYLKNYIDEVLISLNNITKKANLTIKVNCEKDIKINSFPGDFSQIITNLIVNSIKHAYENEKKGLIIININYDEEIIKLTFKDDGQGITKENLPKVFEPFFTTARIKGGTGLGLNIVYNIVTSKLKGNIICTSKEGLGTEFIIHIPNY